MNKTIIISGLIAVCAFYSCSKKSDTITDEQDYTAFLTIKDNNNMNALNNENHFWMTKYMETPNQWSYLIKLAGINSQIFEQTGDIDKLYLAEKQLISANKKTMLTKASVVRMLAKNYITQHRFKDAYNLLQHADSLGEGKNATTKMLFDVSMELGMYDRAQQYLDTIRTETFDYYIRLSKWYDYLGKLDAAIVAMETAVDKAEKNKDEYRMLWSYSNLADFYGHAGRIEDSYNYYLKSLALDSNYHYALKGIAWIVFSRDNDVFGARKIIEYLQQKRENPDYHLLLAELAEYEGDEATKEKHLAAFNSSLKSKNYGEMYNTYLIQLLAEKPGSEAEALAIAKKEVSNRATPETFDLLAWAYLKNGEKEMALEIAQNNVIGKTFEPNAAFHTAEILKANGFTDEAILLKAELLDALYELGPNMQTKIQAI